ncbi:hypothetical protein LI142_13760 [Eubacterium limosum]|uniref:hypothetical protein n=1 Tax=Eubacterium limosum TaxID=1736 RepID=UPI001D0872F3|nr:hypothetical protein [Eubacterium limosum]MCB6570565.1 hypothetical protein [Eubacterium limosum]
MKNTCDDSKNIIEQMVDGIVGKETPNFTDKEKEIRKYLAGRAAEYFMFMGDDEEQDNGK